ncbi:hypothetical protein IEQ34_013038 [Dendrobium chrysotoxum]|uniref:Uncharacterized protein n=1 Tax=Dendrobium chrysotoxum TaxID=161865 RepID=A0AAV7GPY1_DENCH|nr:hypothetical protein IEQ34_013038 [Dendrobium chrysotoxum]
MDDKWLGGRWEQRHQRTQGHPRWKGHNQGSGSDLELWRKLQDQNPLGGRSSGIDCKYLKVLQPLDFNSDSGVRGTCDSSGVHTREILESLQDVRYSRHLENNLLIGMISNKFSLILNGIWENTEDNYNEPNSNDDCKGLYKKKEIFRLEGLEGNECL